MSKLKICQHNGCAHEVSRGSAWCTQHTVPAMLQNALNNHMNAFGCRRLHLVQATLNEQIIALDWYFKNTDWSAFKLHHWAAAYVHVLNQQKATS